MRALDLPSLVFTRNKKFLDSLEDADRIRAFRLAAVRVCDFTAEFPRDCGGGQPVLDLTVLGQRAQKHRSTVRPRMPPAATQEP